VSGGEIVRVDVSLVARWKIMIVPNSIFATKIRLKAEFGTAVLLSPRRR